MSLLYPVEKEVNPFWQKLNFNFFLFPKPNGKSKFVKRRVAFRIDICISQSQNRRFHPLVLNPQYGQKTKIFSSWLKHFGQLTGLDTTAFTGIFVLTV